MQLYLSRHIPRTLLYQTLTYQSCQYRYQSGLALAFSKYTNQLVDPNQSPLLIYHGLFGSKNNWKSLSQQLCKQTKRTVYAFDLRNHGDSPHSDQTDLPSMASDIQYFIENNQLDKVCLMGHSLGGRVVSQFAFNTPEKLEKIILVDISPLEKLPKIGFLDETLFDDAKNVVQNLSPVLDLSKARTIVGEELMKRIKDKFVVDFLLMSLYKTPNGTIQWKFNVDALKNLVSKRLINNIQITKPYLGPALLIHGQKSNYVLPEDYEQIRQHLPSAQFVCVPDTDHYLHVQNPAKFLESVVQFLK